MDKGILAIALYVYASCKSLNAFVIEPVYGVLMYVVFVSICIAMLLLHRKFKFDKNAHTLECLLIANICIFPYVVVGLTYIGVVQFLGKEWSADFNGPMLVAGLLAAFAFACYESNRFEKKLKEES